MESNGFILLDDKIVSLDERMNFEDSRGYKYYSSFYFVHRNIERNSIISPFDISNKYHLENIKNWIKINNKKFELINLDSIKDKRDILLFHCLECDETWDNPWGLILQNIGCPYCRGKRVAKSKSLGVKFPELVSEWDYKKNKKSPFEYLPGSGKKVWWICNQCENSWETVIYNRTRIHTGCPACCMSGSAKKIYFLLRENNINFNIEQKFDNLISKYGVSLRYDFSILYNDKIVYLIEYDGEQHDRFVEYFHGDEKEFMYRVDNDNIKTKYALDIGIPLRRIKYNETDKIDNIIIDILSHISGEEVEFGK
jgi:DNA-directed RNA polymerase subunit RPC12/RpoP